MVPTAAVVASVLLLAALLLTACQILMRAARGPPPPRCGTVRVTSVDCVIAACNDDAEVEHTRRVVKETYGPDVRFFVYGKCGSERADGVVRLPNTGREQHTYAHHVAKHYDDLADVVVFTPSNVRKRGGREATLRSGWAAVTSGAGFHCTARQTFGSMAGWRHPPLYEGRRLDRAQPQGVRRWALEHLGRYPPDTELACKWGTFIATRETIRKRPRALFAHVRDELDRPEPEAGHYMERLAPILYGGA